MAKRLIDLNGLVLEYVGLAKISPYDYVGICKYFANQLINLPIVDAVEVVRCVRCKYWDVDTDTYGDGFGPEGNCFGICDGAKTKHDDFCSYGERRCEDG